jgi:hypothetical protein
VLSELSSRRGTNELDIVAIGLSATCCGREANIGYASSGIILLPCACFCEYVADDGRKTETCSIIMRRRFQQNYSHVFAVAQLVEALGYKQEGRGFYSRWYHWNFSLTSFWLHCGHGVDSSSRSTRNISWVVKADGAWGSQPYHLHVPIVLKSGSLSLLEPSGPVQDCYGIVLPFYGRV